MKNYDSKFKYLWEHQKTLCAMTGKWLSHSSKVDMQHCCHQTKWRRKKFPLFIDSILNLRLVDHSYHLTHGSELKIYDLQAEKYEKFLERHPMISQWVNNPV